MCFEKAAFHLVWLLVDRENGAVWELRRHETRLATITVTGYDDEDVIGTFAPEREFDVVAPLFAAQSALGLLPSSEIDDHAIRAWEALYDTIHASMVLIAPSGPVRDFMLSIWDACGEIPAPGREVEASFQFGDIPYRYRGQFTWQAENARRSRNRRI